MHLNIHGLDYLPSWVNPEEEAKLIARIDREQWSTELTSRRVQHYGWKYNYADREVRPDAYLGPLPDFLAALAQRLQREAIFATIPDQAILNEYQPGQGIGDHVDCVPCFDDTVASLTLGSGCTMRFKHLRNEAPYQDTYLERGSLIALRGQARYDWTHGIPKLTADPVGDQNIPRARRISITFRNVIPPVS